MLRALSFPSSPPLFLSVAEKNKVLLAEHGMIPAVMKAIKEHTDEEDVLFCLCGIIRNMCLDGPLQCPALCSLYFFPNKQFPPPSSAQRTTNASS